MERAALKRARLTAAQRRYEQTEKGKAAKRRYERTAKGKATQRRYLETAAGKAARQRHMAKRIGTGHRCYGYAKTAEQARLINAHIKERLSAFQRQQSGAKTEGVAAGAVRAETASRENRL